MAKDRMIMTTVYLCIPAGTPEHDVDAAKAFLLGNLEGMNERQECPGGITVDFEEDFDDVQDEDNMEFDEEAE